MSSETATTSSKGFLIQQPRRKEIQNDETSQQPLFLKNTYNMISNCPSDIAGWSEDGTSIVVKDANRLAAEIIPTVYKHNKFSSFVRQLNFYGFRKLRFESRANYWEFKHPLFRRGDMASISQIKKSAHVQDCGVTNEVIQMKDEMSEVKNQVTTLNQRVTELNQIIENFSKILLTQSSSLLALAAVSHFPHENNKYLYESNDNIFNTNQNHQVQTVDVSSSMNAHDFPLNDKKRKLTLLSHHQNHNQEQGPFPSTSLSSFSSSPSFPSISSVSLSSSNATDNSDVTLLPFADTYISISHNNDTDKVGDIFIDHDNNNNDGDEDFNFDYLFGSEYEEEHFLHKNSTINTDNHSDAHDATVTDNDNDYNNMMMTNMADKLSHFTNKIDVSDIPTITQLLPRHLQDRFIDQLAFVLSEKLVSLQSGYMSSSSSSSQASLSNEMLMAKGTTPINSNTPTHPQSPLFLSPPSSSACDGSCNNIESITTATNSNYITPQPSEPLPSSSSSCQTSCQSSTNSQSNKCFCLVECCTATTCGTTACDSVTTGISSTLECSGEKEERECCLISPYSCMTSCCTISDDGTCCSINDDDDNDAGNDRDSTCYNPLQSPSASSSSVFTSPPYASPPLCLSPIVDEASAVSFTANIVKYLYNLNNNNKCIPAVASQPLYSQSSLEGRQQKQQTKKCQPLPFPLLSSSTSSFNQGNHRVCNINNRLVCCI